MVLGSLVTASIIRSVIVTLLNLTFVVDITTDMFEQLLTWIAS